MKTQYQPKTGQKCSCKRGLERDNCAACEGTGWRIDFAAIRASTAHYRTYLPAFRVTYTDGESYITSMAHGTTLADAQAYFIGQSFEQADERTKKTVATVEAV